MSSSTEDENDESTVYDIGQDGMNAHCFFLV